jgi:2-polyprenyl-6-methoxyphenol hydroxylase-like FAD-dependent oxidoreductase
MRVIICGIAGLTAAWWLNRAGWNVILIERGEQLSEGCTIDFLALGGDVLEQMGLTAAQADAGPQAGHPTANGKMAGASN